MKTNTRSYDDLLVWQKATALAKIVHRFTQKHPSSDKFNVVAQLRRAAVSIASNIAEGHALHTTDEFIQFISHAERSVAELDTQLPLSVELGFCREVIADPAFELIAELRRMLKGLRRKLSSRQ